MKRFWLGILSLGMVASCATQQVERIQDRQVVLNEVPENFKGKFEVVQMASPFPSTSPSPQPLTLLKPTPTPKPTPHPKVVPFIERIPTRAVTPMPFQVGERMILQVSYFGVVGGTIVVDLLPNKMMNGREVYNAFGRAKSSALFSAFYRVDDTMETFFDAQGLFSYKFQMILDESKQTKDSLELYDSDKKKSFWSLKWNHWKKGKIESKQTFDMEPFSQDSLSSLYYVRTLPLKIGYKFRIPVIGEGQTTEALGKVVGFESCDTPLGEKQCFKIQLQTRFKGIINQTGDSFLYLTNDQYRAIVLFDAKVRIGSLKFDLEEFYPRGGGPDPW